MQPIPIVFTLLVGIAGRVVRRNLAGTDVDFPEVANGTSQLKPGFVSPLILVPDPT